MNRRTFFKQSAWGALQFGILAEALAAEPELFKNPLPRSSPEESGFSSQAILNFLDTVGDKHLHSLMIVAKGHVIAEGWWSPYRPDLKHTLYSLSKSFTSTAIGFAVSEGKLSVDDRVISFFPDKLPTDVNENLRQMRIRDLLTMSTGHESDTVGHFRSGGEKDWMKAFLAQPVVRKPGTHFVYNSGATYMLAAILKKATGENLTAFLKPRLFQPLEIHDFDWETDPQGIEVGGWGLRLTTESIARFGQLFLQQGNWKGRSVLPSQWIEEATRAHTMQPGEDKDRQTSDWLQGYGYQFWRCRHNAYRGDGAFGQYCIVMPDQQMVIAITSETNDMQGVLNAVWANLLNPVPKTMKSEPLKGKMRTLKLPFPGENGWPEKKPFSGQSEYTADSNNLDIQSIGFLFQKKRGSIFITDSRGRHQLDFGAREWEKGKTGWAIEWLKLVPTAIPGNPPLPTCGAAFMEDENTLTVHVRFIDTAHYLVIKITFNNDRATVAFHKSISIIGGDARPSLTLNLTQKL